MKNIIGIVAEKLGHSLSPHIHNYWSKKYNKNLKYQKFEIIRFSFLGQQSMILFFFEYLHPCQFGFFSDHFALRLIPRVTFESKYKYTLTQDYQKQREP